MRSPPRTLHPNNMQSSFYAPIQVYQRHRGSRSCGVWDVSMRRVRRRRMRRIGDDEEDEGDRRDRMRRLGRMRWMRWIRWIRKEEGGSITRMLVD